jgi:hypothetical protein
VPFYVGKGTDNRAYVKKNRNKYWHNIVNKYGYEVKLIAKDIDEEFALLIEVERIDQLKRLNIKICNMTSGGEGISGYKFTDEQKIKLSNSHKGYKPSEETIRKLSAFQKGRKKSQDWKDKISVSNKGKKRTKEQNEAMSKVKSKAVYCITEDKYFDGAKQASIYYGLSDGAVSMVCCGKRNSVKKMKFCYVKDKEEV